MGSAEFSGLGELAKLAVSGGPFFFAVFVLVVGTQRARSYYYDVCSRTSPAATPQEIATYRGYFVYTWILGCLLVIGSVAWWIYTQTRGTYTYQVAIVDVEPGAKIETDFYQRVTFRARAVDSKMIQDYYFLIVQDKPFAADQKFAFDVYILPAQTALTAPIASNVVGQAITPSKVVITYSGKLQDRYRLERDQGSGVKIVALADDETPRLVADAHGGDARAGMLASHSAAGRGLP
jgi:hypothetical protein